MPSLTVNRPATDVELPVATADQRQADYFRRLLAQDRRHIDQRLSGYRDAIATAKAAGDTEGATSLRHMACVEEQDRQTLDGLIENLDRRFPYREADGVPQGARRARAAAR